MSFSQVHLKTIESSTNILDDNGMIFSEIVLVIFCHSLSYFVILCHIISCHIMPYCGILWHIMAYSRPVHCWFLIPSNLEAPSKVRLLYATFTVHLQFAVVQASQSISSQFQFQALGNPAKNQHIMKPTYNCFGGILATFVHGLASTLYSKYQKSTPKHSFYFFDVQHRKTWILSALQRPNKSRSESFAKDWHFWVYKKSASSHLDLLMSSGDILKQLLLGSLFLDSAPRFSAELERKDL